MRGIVILAGFCLAGTVGLLVVRDGRGDVYADRDTPGSRSLTPLPPGQRPQGPTKPVPEPLPDIAALVAARPRAPQTQEELAGFVALCARRGEEVVPELRALLERGTNVTLKQRWEFTAEGQLKGYPTLRSAVIDALGQIPGRESADVLRGLVEAPAVIQEACLAAHALARRGVGGWAPAALRQAAGKTSAVRLPYQYRLVEMAADRDPAVVAEHIVRAAPRGEDARDPKVVARALAFLPDAAATRAAWQLLADREVTTRAKARYVRALCDRGAAAPAVFQQIHDVAASAEWPAQLKTDAATAAANAKAFLLDENEFIRAKARRDDAAATAIRARFDERLLAVERLVHQLVGADPADPRAAAVLRTLARHRKRLK